MSSHKNHPYHLVNVSPILGSFSAMIMMKGLIKWFHMFGVSLFLLWFMNTLMIMYH